MYIVTKLCYAKPDGEQTNLLFTIYSLHARRYYSRSINGITGGRNNEMSPYCTFALLFRDDRENVFISQSLLIHRHYKKIIYDVINIFFKYMRALLLHWRDCSRLRYQCCPVITILLYYYLL